MRAASVRSDSVQIPEEAQRLAGLSKERLSSDFTGFLKQKSSSARSMAVRAVCNSLGSYAEALAGIISESEIPRIVAGCFTEAKENALAAMLDKTITPRKLTERLSSPVLAV